MANMYERDGLDPTLPAINNLAATMGGDLAEYGGAAVVDAPYYESRQFQYQFLEAAMREADRLDYEPRTVRGPHHAAFNDYVRGVHEGLRGINPNFDQGYMLPAGYRTHEVTEYLETHPKEKRLIEALRQNRVWDLRRLGRQIHDATHSEELPLGLLDTPPYHRQGEMVETERARQLCMNACFRMLHHGIAGWSPDEDLLADQLSSRHGSIVVDDNEYFKIFQTAAFKEVSDRTIKVVEVLGADFQTINKLTTGIKTKYPDAKVYAMVSMGSNTALDRDVWHTGILLQADKNDVVYHDPAAKEGMSERLTYTRSFMQHWAIAYNRVQLVIAI